MSEFDFDAHREAAVAQYRSLRPAYQQLAEVGRRILSDILQVTDIRFHSVEARAKTLESFGVKVAKPSESDPAQPKYFDPLRQITDLAGIRVITFLPRTLEQVCRHIEQEFTVLERADKAAELMDEGKFGYQSIHFIVEMHPNRVRAPSRVSAS